VFGPREWIFLVTWPWILAGVVAVIATGSLVWVRGEAAATVLAGGIALLAFVGAPFVAIDLRSATGFDLTKRAAILAGLAGALALPALVAVTLASPSAPGTVLCGALVVMLSAYSLIRASALAGRAYPAVAILWIAAPAFVHYLLRDLLERRADWVLALGPASGAAWMVQSPSAWGRLWWPAAILLLVSVALTVAGGKRRTG
jgi:hypothetical protein